MIWSALIRTIVLRWGSGGLSLGPGAVAWSVPDEPHGVANESDGDLVFLVAMAPNPNV